MGKVIGEENSFWDQCYMNDFEIRTLNLIPKPSFWEELAKDWWKWYVVPPQSPVCIFRTVMDYRETLKYFHWKFHQQMFGFSYWVSSTLRCGFQAHTSVFLSLIAPQREKKYPVSLSKLGVLIVFVAESSRTLRGCPLQSFLPENNQDHRVGGHRCDARVACTVRGIQSMRCGAQRQLVKMAEMVHTKYAFVWGNKKLSRLYGNEFIWLRADPLKDLWLCIKCHSLIF